MSADPTLDTLAKLRDASQWRIVENVPIFKCFSQTVIVDGKPVLMSVTDLDLYAICQNYQRRIDETATVGRITPGHIKPLAPETEQPSIYGYPMNLRVGGFGPKNELAILCDLYVRPECFEDFKRYPYRSPEYYPDRKEITGVALLIRDPKLDLGMLTFSGRPGCFYFAMEATATRTHQASMFDDDGKPIDPTRPPVAEETQDSDGALPVGPEGVPEDYHGHWMACMRHHFPEAYAAMAFPSGNNAAMPKPARTESQHMSQPTAPTTPAVPAATVATISTPGAIETEPQRMAREQQAAQFARQEERLRLLEGQLAEERSKRERAEVERQLIQFESECIGIRFDRATELERMIAMTAESRGKHLQYMREFYGRDLGDALTHPAHQGFIDQADSPTLFQADDDEFSRQDLQMAQQFMRDKPGLEWEQYVEMVHAAKDKGKKKTA